MTESENILIGTIPAELVRKPIKNVYIRVYPPDGKVVISVPGRMTTKKIEEFIDSKRKWISKQHERLKNVPGQGPMEFVNGEYHSYEGRKYSLRIIEGTKNISVRLYDGSIIMSLDKDYDRAAREKLMDAWYRHSMKCKIPGLKEKWEEKMHLNVSEVRIRKMKTKWGTCNVRDRRIWLSLELAKYPDSILEYIFVHEMVHLMERSHNRRFYALMDKYLPDWKERKKIMRTSPD
ncbi:MAG: SprT family zinc-dependent metalloprotease [Bacteroidales bacterium]|nr:SprT family zinc-dependent metalloprotease [Bacteroidales bacterium]